MAGFGARLADAINRRGPLCLGIDPHPELLDAWGLARDAHGLAAFSEICVAAFAGFAVVKPQVAFFEAYGSAGYAVLERTIAALSENRVLVLADAVTASPYLGFGSLCPLLDTAAAHGRGVFVLAATSNPEGAEVQGADAGGRTVAQVVVDAVAAVNRQALPEPGWAGVVVGATAPKVPDLSALGGPVLVPGVGAQGGRPEALGGLGGAQKGQLLVAASRDVLRSGPDVGAVRSAAERLRDAVAYLA